MTGKITLYVSLYPWECECCGSGDHYEIYIPELDRTFSHNDQFGGKLNESHDDFPDFVEYTMDPGYVIKAYEDLGYEVIVEGYEYNRDYYKEN